MPNNSSAAAAATATGEPESGYAWTRLLACVLIGTVGSVGMWSVVVALPAFQADFGVARGDASLPYTLAMIGFAAGAVLMGSVADRWGISASVKLGALMLAVGFAASAVAGNIWQFALVHLLIGFGSSASFAPLIADISHWFNRRRGIAVAISASGNYLGGAIWPPIVNWLIAGSGWRSTQMVIAFVCLATMVPLTLAMRRRVSAAGLAAANGNRSSTEGTLGLSPNALMALLALAGVGCCVAMSMPQVHIVAYCADLGYGPARGAEMLSAMLGFGIISRIASGFIADRIGGLWTMLLGSMLQGVALLLYLMFDGLMSLYVVSALFGLFQGGIVPMYAIIVREYFPPQGSGTRVGILIMSTIVGMALGGWMSGVIFDMTGSYWQAFANGLLWNLLNVTIVVFLLTRRGRVPAYA
jgi:MFS family permease